MVSAPEVIMTAAWDAPAEQPLSVVEPSAAPLRIEVVDDAAGFAALRDEWDQLLAASEADCLFLTWEWLHSWWIHFGQNRSLFIVTVRAASELVAIAPLVRTREWIGPFAISMLEFAGTGSVGSDYLDFIVHSRCETTAVAALTDFLAATGITLRLSSVKEDSLVATAVTPTLVSRGWECREVPMEASPFIDLSIASWDPYLTGLRRKHRSNFTRSLRNLEKEYAIRLERVASDDERRRGLADVISLHLLRREKLGGSNAFSDPRLVAFHQTVTRLALEHGWLRLFVLTANGKPAAALYCFRYGRTFLYYQSGFDPGFERYGVGQVIVGLTIRKAFEEGAGEYDFLHGSETYKFKWTSGVRRLVRLEFYPPGRMGNLHRNTVCAITAMKKFVKRVLRRPPSPAAHGRPD